MEGEESETGHLEQRSGPLPGPRVQQQLQNDGATALVRRLIRSRLCSAGGCTGGTPPWGNCSLSNGPSRLHFDVKRVSEDQKINPGVANLETKPQSSESKAGVLTKPPTLLFFGLVVGNQLKCEHIALFSQ